LCALVAANCDGAAVDATVYKRAIDLDVRHVKIRHRRQRRFGGSLCNDQSEWLACCEGLAEELALCRR
jgi:hypothetical protein